MFVLAPLAIVLKLLLGAILLWVAWEGMRKDHTGAWLAMPAVGLVIVSLYQQELIVLHVPLNFFPFGMAIGISQIAVVVSLNIITMVLMRRFLQWPAAAATVGSRDRPGAADSATADP